MQNERLVREYLGWLRDIRTRRPATIYGYATVFEQFLLYLGRRSLAVVELRELEAFLMRPRPKLRGARPSASTLRREGAVLRGLYSYLSARGYVERNPAALLASPSRPRRDPRVIPEDVWLSVWSHPKLSEEARVVLGLGYFAGLRRAEIANLRSNHVDASLRTLRGFERKGGHDGQVPYGLMLDVIARELPLLIGTNPTLFESTLEALASARAGLLLLPWAEQVAAKLGGHPRIHSLPEGAVDPQITSKRIDRYLREVGAARAFSPHALRYTCATNLARAGMPVQLIQKLLGHSSITTTLVYVRVSDSDVNDWFEGRYGNGNVRRSFGRHQS